MDLIKHQKAIGLASLTILFFAIMARVDYVVHAMLYGHGLEFSYDWAYQYWLAYDTLFVVFAASIAVTYWMGAQKTHRNKKIAAAIFITISLFTLGGFEDLLYFAWSGALPAADETWWWSPWINVFGTWNSIMQIALFTATTATVALTWNIALNENKIEQDKNKRGTNVT